MELSSLQVVHTVDSLDPASGGPARTVPALQIHTQRLQPDWRVVIEVDPSAIEGRLCQGATLLHDHGQWLRINRESAAVARRRNAPRVVTPRGMLSPWALSHKKWRKRIAWVAFAKRDLMQANVLHATSQLELEELRALGVRQPIAMIPNGVDPVPLAYAEADPSWRPYALFLSRVHRKKGVQELLDAWADLAPADWDLVIAGPDEEGMLQRAELPAGVRYVGSVDGEDKRRLMQQARLFVLPTYSENFGVVVAESLMAGVPVITTHGAPWECLQAERCGWWIPMQPGVLRQALAAAMATPPEELRAMGYRGRAYVEQQFTWPEIARLMIEVYEWVLGGGPPPACVVTD